MHTEEGIRGYDEGPHTGELSNTIKHTQKNLMNFEKNQRTLPSSLTYLINNYSHSILANSIKPFSSVILYIPFMYILETNHPPPLKF